jgi:signal transduction histidine kinase
VTVPDPIGLAPQPIDHRAAVSVRPPLADAASRPLPTLRTSLAGWVLLVGALVCILPIAVAIAERTASRGAWEIGHWVLSSAVAALATLLSVRSAAGRTRAIRLAGAIAFALWFLASLSWAALVALGRPSVPSESDVFILAIAFPALAIIGLTVHGRVKAAEEIAVYLDAALVTTLVATGIVLTSGLQAIGLPAISGIIAILYPAAFIGLAAAAVIALIAARYRPAAHGGYAFAAGSLMVGIAYLGWIAPTASGSVVDSLSAIQLTVGTLIAAFGIVTWSDDRLTGDDGSAWTFLLSRAWGPAAAGVTFLALLVHVDPAIDPLIHAAVFVAGAIFVIRQALLLRERTDALAEIEAVHGENDRLVVDLRRQLEDRAHVERRMIQASRSAAVGELAAGVAHEVNNPLTGVLGYAELLLEDLDATDPRRGDVETIRAEALRARSIVRALRDFARPVAPSMERIDLADTVRRTVDLIRYPLERRGVTIEESSVTDLPELMADGQAIQQAVLNVLTNAGQAVADDGHVTVRLAAHAREAVIEIRDDGVGMGEEELAQAFDPFYSGRTEPPGLGMGLSVARGLIESHGGTIRLASGSGRGTTVAIHLPLDQGPGDTWASVDVEGTDR